MNSMDGNKQNNITGLAPLNSYRLENLFNVYRTDTNYFYNLINTVTLPANLDPSLYDFYTVPADSMPWTLISYKNYGTTELWWLICSTNNIQNPIQFAKANTRLKILRPSIVTTILNTIKQT